MNHILLFSQIDRQSLAAAGGKGANLGELTQAGFAVPPGFVVTTAVYDQFIQHHDMQSRIVEIANDIFSDDPHAAQNGAAQIQQLFEKVQMPDALSKQIIEAWQALGADAVAVRSSATAEDLPEASFAGQQDTFLNIRSEAALLDAVKRCWASLWTARAITYRQRQEIDPDSVSLAVMVQTLIDADASGILFTANPIDGDREQILINATWGLGEAIVGGLVTPDSIVVEKADWHIVSRETNKKLTMTVRTADGTTEEAVPQEKQDEAVLDDDTAVQLAQIGTQIEDHYGMPMDIEWAISDGKIYILQARPITALPAAPLKNVAWEPLQPGTIWMRRQIVEHMPEPLSPLFEDLYIHQGLNNSVTTLVAHMGDVTEADFDFWHFAPNGFANTINGYAYTTGSFDMSWENLKAIVQIYSKIYRLFDLELFDWENIALPTYLALAQKWDAIDLEQTDEAILLEAIRELAEADSSYWFGSALNLGLSRGLDPLFDRFLKSPLVGGEPPLASAAFLRGFDSKALDAQADMEALADQIRQSDSLRDLVLNTDSDQLLNALAATPEGTAVQQGIQQYLDEYGHQIYNLDFAAPTQNEDPAPLLLSLKALVKNPPAQDVRARQAHMVREREALVAQTERRLNPLSRRLFLWAWKWTKKYAPYREHVMFYMGAAWPTLRKLARELGQRLTDAGVIESPDDVYYLKSDEITAVLQAKAHNSDLPNYAAVAQERRELRQARQLLTPPPKVPLGTTLKFGPLDLSMFDPTPEEAGSEGPILHGYAVSTGKVTAPASVIHSAADFEKMEPGTILVCTTTTPAWTPLFSQAVGLVTDVGGALAHGSIVAREYGIPAVMGTGDATERIRSGAMLAVDGDKGTVTLLDEVDETAVAPTIDEVDTAVAKRKKIAIAAIVGAIVGFLWWRRRRK